MAFLSSWFDEPLSCAAPLPLAVSDAAKALIKASEGYCEIPYICAAGVVTIGWGSTYDAFGKPVTLDHARITEPEAQTLFDRDVRLFSRGVKNLLKTTINNNQYSALVSLAYNIGLGNLRASTHCLGN